MIDYTKQLEEVNHILKTKLEEAGLENENLKEHIEELQKQIHKNESNIHFMKKEIAQQSSEIVKLNETIKYHMPRN